MMNRLRSHSHIRDDEGSCDMTTESKMMNYIENSAQGFTSIPFHIIDPSIFELKSSSKFEPD